MLEIGRFATGLHLEPDGIWYAQGEHTVSYPDTGHAACLAVEDDSFWFRHRNACIEAAVLRHGHGGAFFDIGGGNGYVSRGLQRHTIETVVVEPGREGAANARRRALPTVVCATLDSARFRPGSLPSAGVFDVVEHVDDHIGFLRGLRAALRPDGRLYVTVPAYGWLWSQEDVEAGHVRRYTRASLVAALEEAGFALVYASYFFRWLPLPILLLRALPYRLGLRPASRAADDSRVAAAREHGTGGGLAVRAVMRLLAGEVEAIRQERSIVVGGSLLAVAVPR